MKKVFVTTLFALVLCISNAFGLNYSNPESNNYVNEYGKLKLVGNQLCSEKGEPVQLRGWSTHGKNWQGSNFDDKNDFLGMKKHGANVARIAMYLISGGSEDLNWVKQCIQWTNELGMYCLVDWHILTPGNPNDGAYSNAPNFFSALSQWVVQNGYKNVLYEICNEPNENTEGTIYRPNVWKQIKEYSQKVLPKIEQNDPGAIVIIGTPQWDKALVFPMEDPVGEYNLGLMYSFHHYTCDQKQFLGLLSSAAAYIPLFVTEWGLSTDDGGENGQVCEDGGDNLLRICNGKNLGKIRRRHIPKFRRNIGVVFQDFRLLKDRNVYENIAFAQKVIGEPTREIKKKVPAMLSVVGLAAKYRSNPKELSGGEQQRVAIARALINEPSILLADEPTGNLDNNNAWEIMKLLEEINERGTTVIVVTHNMEIVKVMKKRVITVQKGIIVSDRKQGDETYEA